MQYSWRKKCILKRKREIKGIILNFKRLFRAIYDWIKPTTSYVPQVIAIVCSEGEQDSLIKVFKGFQTILPVPIIIVQSVSPAYTSDIVDNLNKESCMKVKEAADGDYLIPGHAYLAPEGFQLSVTTNRIIKLEKEVQTKSGHRVDSMMYSLFDLYDQRILGVMLKRPEQAEWDSFHELRKRGGSVLRRCPPSTLARNITSYFVYNRLS